MLGLKERGFPGFVIWPTLLEMHIWCTIYILELRFSKPFSGNLSKNINRFLLSIYRLFKCLEYIILFDYMALNRNGSSQKLNQPLVKYGTNSYSRHKLSAISPFYVKYIKITKSPHIINLYLFYACMYDSMYPHKNHQITTYH